ncbi:CDP-diacylglycerol--serine O-phosphatidyltransferase [Candidatus Woesearchaeota archaeon]|nr:CDP-diacylglycerol--serine O-phosphatidyltransferase [Candidatus Woesearchaeota archaeon]
MKTVSRMRDRRNFIQISFYLLRIVLAIVVFSALLLGRRNLALLMFVLSIVIGFLDYRRYRRTILVTQFESILNAFADKLLIVLSSIALFANGVLPLWAAALFVAKDVLFGILGAVAWWRNRYTLFRQRLSSKITTFFQVIALIAILFDKLDTVLLAIAAVFTALNGIVVLFRPEFLSAKKPGPFQEYALTKLLKLADLVTLFNALLGLLAIIFAITGSLFAASSTLLVAVVVDFLDGRIARMTGTANEFGKQLDSLSDTISFGVAPAVIGFVITQSRLAIVAISIFLFCGVLRLAKFNIMDTKGLYIGMPITANGIIIPLLIFFSVPVLYFPYIYLFLGILMVAPIQVKKI